MIYDYDSWFSTGIKKNQKSRDVYLKNIKSLNSDSKKNGNHKHVEVSQQKDEKKEAKCISISSH